MALGLFSSGARRRPPTAGPSSGLPTSAAANDDDDEAGVRRGFAASLRRVFAMRGMRVAIVCALALCLLVSSTSAWGGLFNRFNPSMLSNLGFGGSGAASNSYARDLYKAGGENNAQEHNAYSAPLEEILREEIAEELDDPCLGKRCTANEHCCDGHVCVDTEDENAENSFGTCMPIFGKKQGDICTKDHDCESGFVCLKDARGEKSCQTPVLGAQELGEDCRTSSDCNGSKGLCCKLQRRARSQPKKICAYFTDPAVCIGPVSAAHLHAHVGEHTAGEKRRSGHPDYRHIRR